MKNLDDELNWLDINWWAKMIYLIKCNLWIIWLCEIDVLFNNVVFDDDAI